MLKYTDRYNHWYRDCVTGGGAAVAAYGTDK